MNQFLADRLKAMAHPVRLEILQILARRGACVCGELVDLTPLAQSTVSQHLKVLREAGLISGTVEGSRSCYCLDKARLTELQRALAQFMEQIGDGSSATDPLRLSEEV